MKLEEKKQLFDASRIWRNCKLLKEALRMLQNRNCWKKCKFCQKEWKDTNTIYVHMIVSSENNVSKTAYLCDNCLNEID